MPIYLTLDQTEWFRNNFSTAEPLTGTIYSDINKTTARDISGLTITIRMHFPGRLGDRFGKEATIVSGAAGTWTYTVAQAEMPQRGLYYAVVEISDGTGINETTLNPVEFLIKGGPTA